MLKMTFCTFPAKSTRLQGEVAEEVAEEAPAEEAPAEEEPEQDSSDDEKK